MGAGAAGALGGQVNQRMSLDCASHGGTEDWLAICVHVRDGVRPFYFEMPSPERPGQAMCAECYRAPVTRPSPVPVCAGCYRTTIAAQFPPL